MTRTKTRTHKYRQRGRGFDIQKWLGKTRGLNFTGLGTVHGTWDQIGQETEMRRSRHNRLDKNAKQHNIDYSHAKNLQDKWKADTKMIKAIDKLPGSKTMTERIVKRIMLGKKKLKL